ncbi:putative Xaa-Pro aminopeptidase P [Porphyridium purpureum]|uniref:Putative Xaa-Pro aminopeptidase P n=1 Tax=Porphyridium purpureum TaxID=35688 RepID=A0A5J4Z3E3_PORPP|nr:putative Xaa-Pro aminopeptidase P [Porphyridium purpureum]|eukprot:POR6690..scf208_2
MFAFAAAQAGLARTCAGAQARAQSHACRVTAPNGCFEFARRSACIGRRASWHGISSQSQSRNWDGMANPGRLGRGGRRMAMSLNVKAVGGREKDALKDLQQRVMVERGIDALIVPSADPHNSEYAAPCFLRRAFISGFSGSAGTAVILRDKALLWTDGRYFLQASTELSGDWTLMKAGMPDTPTIETFLADSLPENGQVAIDPLVHVTANAQSLEKTLNEKNIKLITVSDTNLIDEVWGTERPGMPAGAVREHPLAYAGKPRTEKLKEIGAAIQKHGADALCVSMLDEVAWLLNIRGTDYKESQLVLSYCLVFADGTAKWYVDGAKVSEELKSSLSGHGVTVCDYEQIFCDISALEKVWLDPQTVSYGIFQKCKEAVLQTSPIVLAKALKNDAELAGMREAHLRDGVALSRFFAWAEEHLAKGNTLTEYEVDLQVDKFRSEQPGHLFCSFPTIAGSGPNGAVIHYRAQEASCRKVSVDELFLLDSGAQYDVGTTDVTRTVHFGEPSAWQKETFTRVLKGHIAIDAAIFPARTPGALLDTLARNALWQAGLDYRHGTGHGVGAALNVHEGPHGISPRMQNTQGLQPGMVVSNEPGYYEDGAFGIRIENLLVVEEKLRDVKTFGNAQFLGFSRLTKVPIQKRMIAVELLSQEERDWIDLYHREVWDSISPRISENDTVTLNWLRASTTPLRDGQGTDSTGEESRRDFIKSTIGLGALALLFGNGEVSPCQ